MSTVTVAVIGCGCRGKSYSKYALDHPDLLKVVSIAEPLPITRKQFAKSFNVDNNLVFNTWQDLYTASTETLSTTGKRLADAVIVAVQDRMHLEVTTAFANQGYHILCEKPMATSIEECIKMEQVIKQAGVIFGMGHVLRYTPYFQQIDEIISSGELGELVNVVHVEPVGYYHFAHSYVRGNWGEENKSSFSLMTKSCHDIDLICHWFAPLTISRISSFGSLQHFRKSAKPKEADTATRCLDCKFENNCPYSAKKIYLDAVTRGNKGWPIKVLVDGVPDIENITHALKTGPYGKCVYESPNDVCDHQVVNLEFSNGTTASFTMVAYTSSICDRQTRWHFTHGEIIGDMNTFTVTNFRDPKKPVRHHPSEVPLSGHGGGDLRLVSAFVEAVREGKQEILGTDISDVLRSHITVFAAEASRREGRVIDYAEFEKRARESANQYV
ncbi:streptomycin biosynthesis protein StrI [Amanita rubescens]|nr:streptomycin biosynthesis protein StrI [Amanita rubescens]